MPIPSNGRVGIPASGALLGAQVVVADQLERGVERLRIVAGVVDRAGRGGERELVRRGKVPSADLGRVHAELGGNEIDGALADGSGLGSTRTPVRTGRRRVREHGDRAEVMALPSVHAGGHEARHQRDERAAHRIGADVGPSPDAKAAERAVAAGADRDVVHLGAPVCHAEQVLGARLDPAHRPAQTSGERDDQDLLDVGAALGAEAAADPGRTHTYLVRCESEDRCTPRRARRTRLGSMPTT